MPCWPCLEVGEAVHRVGNLVAGGGVAQHAANLTWLHVLRRQAAAPVGGLGCRSEKSGVRVWRGLPSVLSTNRLNKQTRTQITHPTLPRCKLTASWSSPSCLSSSLRSSSKGRACSNWRSGCCSGHSRISNALLSVRHSSAADDQPRRRQISNRARAMRGAFWDTYIRSAVREKDSTRAREM